MKKRENRMNHLKTLRIYFGRDGGDYTSHTFEQGPVKICVSEYENGWEVEVHQQIDAILHSWVEIKVCSVILQGRKITTSLSVLELDGSVRIATSLFDSQLSSALLREEMEKVHYHNARFSDEEIIKIMAEFREVDLLQIHRKVSKWLKSEELANNI